MNEEGESLTDRAKLERKGNKNLLNNNRKRKTCEWEIKTNEP